MLRRISSILLCTWATLLVRASEPPPGRYGGPIKVTLEAQGATIQVHYTIDGTTPTKQSRIYDKPIELTKSTVLKNRPFEDGVPIDSVETATYLIGENHLLPSLCISGDPAHFYGPQGILANATEHGREWERPVVMEFFDKEGHRNFALDCGARVHGGYSRNSAGKHSLRLYFRSDYGVTKLNEPIFPSIKTSAFDCLVLRANYNDQVGFSFGPNSERTSLSVKDELARRLFSEMGHLAPSGRFVALYLNGTPRGLYNPVERVDEKFLKTHLGRKTKWDLVKATGSDGLEIKSGDDNAWKDFESWLETVDARDPKFMDALAKRVDIDPFLDYWFLNVWLDNRDWPHNNFYAYRNRDGGRWRFLPWDSEMTLGSWHDGFHMDRNTVTEASSPKDRQGLPNLVCKLVYTSVENPRFRESFWRAHRRLKNGVMEANNISNALAHLLGAIESHIDDELALWGKGRTRQQLKRAEGLAMEFIQARWSIVTEHARLRIRDLERFHALRRDHTPAGLNKLWEIIQDPAQSETLRRECLKTLGQHFPDTRQAFEMLSTLVRENVDSAITESALETLGHLKLSKLQNAEANDLLQSFVSDNSSATTAIHAANTMDQLNLPGIALAYRTILRSVKDWTELNNVLIEISGTLENEFISDLEAVLLRVDTTKSGAYLRYTVAEKVLKQIRSKQSVQLTAKLLEQEPDSEGFSVFNHGASKALIQVLGAHGFPEDRQALEGVLDDDRFPKSVKQLARETIQSLEHPLDGPQ